MTKPLTPEETVHIRADIARRAKARNTASADTVKDAGKRKPRKDIAKMWRDAMRAAQGSTDA